jgi:hypothetical protein
MYGVAFIVTAFALIPCTDEASAGPIPWGARGHEIAARAAAATLPAGIPGFFRDAAPQLVYLNPEPDRWRERSLAEMDQAWSYDHYVDLENVVDVDALAGSDALDDVTLGALSEADRFRYIRRLYESGMERPERDAGFLPFRIVELYQRLVTEWRLWRAEANPTVKAWIQDRIVSDAGLLGHYVTDASNPHHTTIHFNGWDADAPNPGNYTYDRDFHYRFESQFVDAHLDDALVRARMNGSSRSVAGNARAAVLDHLQKSHAQVEELYRLDRDVGFDPNQQASDEVVDFTAERLASGADMLRTLWWSAWLESADGP